MFQRALSGSGGGSNTLESQTTTAGTTVTFTNVDNAYVTCEPTDSNRGYYSFYKAYIENGAIDTEFYRDSSMTVSISNNTLTMSCSYSAYGQLRFNVMR